MARSRNLLEWQPYGVAACPARHHWADRVIHSGNAVSDPERATCFLYYTGGGTKRQGVGLATSTDMEHWGMAPDILLEYPDRWSPDARKQAISAAFEGRTYEFLPCGDPYVFSEKVDGFHWMWVHLSCCWRHRCLARRPCVAGADQPDTLPEPPGGKAWRLVWRDEFDGQKLDASKRTAAPDGKRKGAGGAHGLSNSTGTGTS